MSEKTTRRRRSDAEQSERAVVAAAVRVLGERPGASMRDVAEEAGVSRQTVYAHFPSREALLAAVLDHFTAQVLDEAREFDTAEGSARDALLGFLDGGWDLFARHSGLVRAAAAAASPGREDDLHAPFREILERLVRRGQENGEFDSALSAEWLVAALVALAHAAGEEVHAGRSGPGTAVAALRESAVRLLGAQAEEPRSRQ
ncbi:TetR/AcrR family transcriptional regulator [Nocardiopsis sp. Huas11]|uniref:TetR/AcrR family transcriptional regulator n=1 Tax=Nocardiopsis sp. Huas11 TaxID=2183912 RepID=UPI0018F5086D|nr:TetR/AcrR family transcriptional regulator [Nocardiopsis sp. Huas11]